MLNGRRLIPVALLVVATLAASPAWARRRGRGGGASNAARIASLKAQASFNIAVASQVLGAAVAEGSKAQSKIGAAQSMASSAVETSKEAKGHIDGGHARLKEIEARVANAQQPGSEFNKALDAFEDARDEMLDLREEITTSAEYQSRYDKALAMTGSERSDALAAVKREFFDDNSDYRLAVASYEKTRVKFNDIYHKLLSEDPEWKDAISDLKEARLAAGEANGKLTSAGLSKMDAKQHLKKAAAVASSAQAVIAANQAVLNSLPGRKPNNNPQNSKAPGKK